MLQTDEYMLPYANLVGSDPSVEDMRLVLIIQGARPDIPIRWKCDNVSIININKFQCKQFFIFNIYFSEIESYIGNYSRMLASKSKCKVACIKSHENIAQTRG